MSILYHIFVDMDEYYSTANKSLTDEETLILQKQDSRLVSEYKSKTLETNAQKNWDLFYKRNETRFFKDRRWTLREFSALLECCNSDERKTMLEVGCGVGNLIFPLIEEGLNFYFYACDFSPRAVEIVKSNKLYNESCVKAFQADITMSNVFKETVPEAIDIATLVFVLSAIHPDKFSTVLKNIYSVLKPGGILLFRDYGLYDMAQIRFKPGHKIDENFYMRQDGTRSYYFSTEIVQNLCTEVGFIATENVYVHRRTVNKKENVDVGRIFLQAKLSKPK